jgi:electron transfer flavoprotein alpha subunit
MIAVVVARGGSVVAGSEAAIAEAGGIALVAGDGAAEAAADLAARASAVRAGDECRELRVLELGVSFRPGAWADAIAPHVACEEVVVLPASPDGRDLAPRLAAVLGRPLLAGAIKVTRAGASVVWRQGRQIVGLEAGGPFVATLLPGSRSALAERADGTVLPPSENGSRSGSAPVRVELTVATTSRSVETVSGTGPAELAALVETDPVAASEPELLEVLAADRATIDLAEAERIVAGGAGLGGPEQLALLEVVAAGLGACVGGTRVVTDAGLLGHDRQIGTTGVSVHPRCYLAFGISGAAQHVGGLGTPRHVVAVNLDRSCPMMAMADLGLVTDAGALVGVLAQRLAELPPATSDDLVPTGDVSQSPPAPAGPVASTGDVAQSPAPASPAAAEGGLS